MNKKLQNLGPVKAWQIRDFPELLREEIVAQADVEGVSVSEFATAKWAALRDNGWQVTGGPFPGAGNPKRLEALRELAELAAVVAQNHEGMGKAIAGALKTLIRQELKALRSGIGPVQRALPAPDADPQSLV